MTVRPDFQPPAPAAGKDAGTLVLADGSRSALYRALPEDARQLEGFLDRLPPAERGAVTDSLRLPAGGLAGFLEGLADRRTGDAFFVADGDGDGVVGFGAYRLLDDGGPAAIALAVHRERRGQGLASLLLERLAVLAAHHGVRRLVGRVPADDESLLDLFRRAGFVAADAPGSVGEGEERRIALELDVAAAAAAAPERTLPERLFAAASLRPLFYPRSVAVVGASREPESVGYRILSGLVDGGFAGPVYPVNPRADHVRSVRAYPSLGDIGAPVDLAVVAVPAAIVPAVVEDAAAAGVAALVVISAGFAEIGGEGYERQRRLLEAVRGHGMRMVGPNCLGIVHTDPRVSMNASFTPYMPPVGSVALCSQSGALGVAIIALARRLGLGLSSFVSVGNKADVSGNDLLEYWEEDPSTGVILFYLESFGDPRRFARIARRVGRAKPIVVVKAGRSEAGGRAASSHTAALTAADTAVDALFGQTGILRADTLEEMFGLARVLSDQPLPRGRRTAVVTNAGGPAILAVDALEAGGLEVEPLAADTRARLAEFLPPEAATGNPVDMIASATPESYRRAVEVVLAAPEVDALVVLYTPVGIVDTSLVGRAVLDGVAAARQTAGAGDKPVLASIVGAESETHRLVGEDETIPAFAFPEEMGRVLGKVADYADWRRADPGVFPELADQDLDAAREIARRPLDGSDDAGEDGAGEALWLGVGEARRLLELAGLQVPPGDVADSAERAVAIAEEIGYPVAAKLASRVIVHKTEVNGVRLDLGDAAAVRRAFEEIAGRLEREGRLDAMDGVLVQPMIEGGAEVMIGADVDPLFGPLVAFGLGGIHVEILRDVVFRVSPLTDRDAHRMVREIRGLRLLEGYRGHPAADLEALEEALVKISRLVEAVPEIVELDLNPVLALPPGEGYRVVDARIKVARPGT